MIGYWHVLHRGDPCEVRVSLAARVGGFDLIVERCDDDVVWHWAVTNRRGREIESGDAPNAETAERLAEDAAFHIHPPTIGDWVGRLI